MRLKRYLVGFEDQRGEYVAWFLTKRAAIKHARSASRYGGAVVVRRRRHNVTHVLAFLPLQP